MPTDTLIPTISITAERVGIIRPCDSRAQLALRRLAATAGAHIRRGSVLLGDGAAHPALLASRDGTTLAALLIGASEDEEEDTEDSGALDVS